MNGGEGPCIIFLLVLVCIRVLRLDTKVMSAVLSFVFVPKVMFQKTVQTD